MCRLAALLAVVVGYSAFVASAAGTEAQALERFEDVVRRCELSYGARPTPETAYVPALSTWVKRAYSPASIKYDVTRTDSIASPFIAELRIAQVVTFARGATEGEAAAIRLDEAAAGSTTTDVRLRYAWRKDAWVLTGGASHFLVGGRPTSAEERLEALKARAGPIHACLE